MLLYPRAHAGWGVGRMEDNADASPVMAGPSQRKDGLCRRHWNEEPAVRGIRATDLSSLEIKLQARRPDESYQNIGELPVFGCI